MPPSLLTQLPWTTAPLIANAPMGGFAGAQLAVAVSEAGGLGFIGTITPGTLKQELSAAVELLQTSKTLDTSSSKTLPIGIGMLPFITNIDDMLPHLAQNPPAVIWLFAAKERNDYAAWAEQSRKVCPDTRIWVQVGSVSAALEIAKSTKPDALVLQGSDAGGHGFENGASIVSLIPEAIDTLAANGYGDIPLLASGGIADGRGAAAAFALGAKGAVMGTRFLAAKETAVPPGYRDLVLAARDGGMSTVRSKLFDNVKGPNIWPEEYDGRSLVTKSYMEHVQGVAIEEIREKHNEAVKGADQGFGSTNRANVWAGAGVGLVNTVTTAADIVSEVRSGIRLAFENPAARA
ncbi:uncharacterized protein Z518_05424 [Rhinocladiella mackenziei CBS 650.93]|uniref:Nitronate monooxygenase domain-containing protein n=1 Tax=Rhinocladiella mackenziei CBS 650.93 TaxID=1442369 RepID=A0A0D2IFG8_9EURO|nr:uncharacterized protein Z518_05424 [Rhinocladiella mackenziei CBS 650.93]KIX04554.1 hypothetical protein Z518_05424 [Rhinocladiella mackenziei CBS 650.93]